MVLWFLLALWWRFSLPTLVSVFGEDLVTFAVLSRRVFLFLVDTVVWLSICSNNAWST